MTDQTKNEQNAPDAKPTREWLETAISELEADIKDTTDTRLRRLLISTLREYREQLVNMTNKANNDKPLCRCGEPSTRVITIPGQSSTGICPKCWDETLVETAQNALNNWKFKLAKLPKAELIEFVEELLDAQATISRAEERKEVIIS